MAGLSTLTRIATRDLRGNARHFVIFLFSLILGTATIATVGLLLSSAQQGIKNDADGLLGGDILVRTLYQSPPKEAKDYMVAQGKWLEYSTLRTMARVANERPDKPNSINAQIAELKSVPPSYPLAGSFTTNPSLEYDALYHAQNGIYGAAVEQELLSLLELSIGDAIMVGEQRFTIRAIITNEPDRLGANYSLGPRIMIAEEALQATGLVQFGSMINYVNVVKLNDATRLADVESMLMETHNNGSFQLRTTENAAPGLKRALDRLGLFLTFAAIATLLIGGIGIANATKSYLSSRLLTIARFKCLGTTQKETLWIYTIQMGLLCLTSIIIGLGFAILIQQAILSFFANSLPVATDNVISATPLLIAAAYGICTTLLFSAPALVSAVKTSPTALLRHSAVQQSVQLVMTPGLIAICLLGFAAIIILTIIFVDNLMLTLVFFAAFSAAALAFYGLAALIKHSSKRFSNSQNRSIATRMALKNLARPHAMTTSFSLSLGLSLTLMAALGIIAANFYQQLRYSPPEEAPDFFLVDIQPHQYEAFRDDINSRTGVDTLELMPMIRGRITELNGKPLTAEMVDPKVRWALQGERGITFSDTPPDNNGITEGEWWPKNYAGEPLVSFGDELAEGMGIKVDDVMTFNVGQQMIHARVASLREIDWTTLQMNFGIILSPNAMPDMPPLYLGTVHINDAEEINVLRHLLTHYPSISVIRIKATLKRVSELFGSVATLILAVGGLTIIAGICVIFGSLGTTLRNRAYESMLLNVLGQTRRAIRHIVTREMAYLCVSGVVLALAMGSLISYVLADLMRLPRWLVIPDIYIGGIALAVILVIGLSHWLIRTISTARPIDFLRNE